MWEFPKIMGFPPKSSILIGFSIIDIYKPSILGIPPIFGNTHVFYWVAVSHVFLFVEARIEERVEQALRAKLPADSLTWNVDSNCVGFHPYFGEDFQFDEHIFQMG